MQTNWLSELLDRHGRAVAGVAVLGAVLVAVALVVLASGRAPGGKSRGPVPSAVWTPNRPAAPERAVGNTATRVRKPTPTTGAARGGTPTRTTRAAARFPAAQPPATDRGQ
jgi:hypothetical protein